MIFLTRESSSADILLIMHEDKYLHICSVKQKLSTTCYIRIKEHACMDKLEKSTKNSDAMRLLRMLRTCERLPLNGV